MAEPKFRPGAGNAEKQAIRDMHKVVERGGGESAYHAVIERLNDQILAKLRDFNVNVTGEYQPDDAGGASRPYLSSSDRVLLKKRIPEAREAISEMQSLEIAKEAASAWQASGEPEGRNGGYWSLDTFKSRVDDILSGKSGGMKSAVFSREVDKIEREEHDRIKTAGTAADRVALRGGSTVTTR